MSHHTEIPSKPFELTEENFIPIAAGVVFGVLLVAVMIRLVIPSGRGKANLGRARWATDKEVKDSAKSVIKDTKTGKDVTTWLGDPKNLYIDQETGAIALPYDPKTFYMGRLNEHLAFLAQTGSGKSYSIHDPIALTFIKRGWPLILLDVKGHEEQYEREDIPNGIYFRGEYGDKIAPSSKLAGVALKHGYDVSVLGPGFPDSDRLNPITLMRDELDATTAFVLAKVIRDNLMAGKSSGDNDFFDESANLLIQAIFMFIKGLPQGIDLVTAHYILNLPYLIQALSGMDLNPYVKAQFDQFLRTEKAEETSDSIAGTAAIAYARFITQDLTSVFCKDTNVPIKLGRKQMVIYRINLKDLHAVGPLMGAIMSLQIDRNVFGARNEPIMFGLDELARIKLNELRDRMDIARSNMGCFVVGAQGFESFDQKWGKGQGEIIVGGAKTEIIGGVKGRTAKYYSSERLGKMDLTVLNTGRSNTGKGITRSKNKQANTVELLQQSELPQIPKGRFIIMSPTTKGTNGNEGLPVLTDVTISKHQQDEMKEGERIWREHRRWKIHNTPATPLSEEALFRRASLARTLFPEPKEDISPADY